MIFKPTVWVWRLSFFESWVEWDNLLSSSISPECIFEKGFGFLSLIELDFTLCMSKMAEDVVFVTVDKAERLLEALEKVCWLLVNFPENGLIDVWYVESMLLKEFSFFAFLRNVLWCWTYTRVNYQTNNTTVNLLMNLNHNCSTILVINKTYLAHNALKVVMSKVCKFECPSNNKK